MVSSRRKYVLFGELSAKYRGKVISERIHPGEQNFWIDLYDVEIINVRITEQSFLDCLYQEQDAKEAIVNGPIRIFPEQAGNGIPISGRKVKLFSPVFQNVTRQGLMIFGELTGKVCFDLEEKVFAYKPVNEPVPNLRAPFPGFKQIEPEPQPIPRPPINWKKIFSIIGHSIALLLVTTFAFTFFLAIHPAFLLLGVLLAGGYFIWNQLPFKVTQWVGRYIHPVLNALFMIFGVLILVLFVVPVIVPVLIGWVAYLLFFGGLAVLGGLLNNLRPILQWMAIIGGILLIFYFPVLQETNEWNPTKVGERAYQPIVSPAPNAEQATIQQTEGDTIWNTINWLGPEERRLSVTYRMLSRDIQTAKTQRLSIQRPIREDRDFAAVFQTALAGESIRIASFTESLDSLREANQMDQATFRLAVVQLVQQLRYHNLMPENCPINSGNVPCLAHVQYGFFSPTEYLSRLQGDCDTKALLLFELFDEYEFDVVLMGSLVYQHAMIGIADPNGAGDYFLVNGKRYYTWEVTSPGWPMGQMPPNCNKMEFWEPLLVSK